MIGGLLGILIAFTYLSTSWNGPYSQENIFDVNYFLDFAWLGGLLIVGIFFFPKTIGLMFTPVIFVLPVAVAISFFRHGLIYALSQIIIGIAGWLVTILIGRFRPDAT